MNGPALTLPDVTFVRQLVLKHSGISLDETKGYLIESRLLEIARRHRLSDPAQVVHRVRAGDESLRREVVDSLTINETSFFRDGAPFEALRLRVLPELIRRRADERSLVIWSAACSSGQEPYSIAMLIREHFPQLLAWRLRILATDLSRLVLHKARSGLYSAFEVGRGLPPLYLSKYFQRVGLDWQIRDDIRNMVEFAELNLIEPWPLLPASDVVFLRNVIIYFQDLLRGQVLGRVWQVLKPDGYLFLGSSESPVGLSKQFVAEEVGNTCVYRPRKPVGLQSTSAQKCVRAV